MKITIKTLQQKAFSIVIDEEETVLKLKEKIEAEQGSAYPTSGLKLIYSGKILNDGNKISEYKIQESSFVVVMVSKGKVTSSQASTSSASTPSTSGTTPDPPSTTTQTQSTPMETTPQPEPTPTTSGSTTVATPMEQTDTGEETPSQSGSSLQDNAASTLVVGEDYNKAITNLIEMGFTEEQAKRAMEVSFNNPHRAAEYLFEHPDIMETPPVVAGQNVLQQQQPAIPEEGQQLQPSLPQVGTEGQEPSEELVGEGAMNPSEIFRLFSQIPQLDTLRTHLRANPGMLPMLLNQIRESNPQLFDVISQNQAEFLRVINSDETRGGGGGGSGGGGGGGGGPPGTFSIQVTAQEKEAIDRLKGLGFAEHLVVQAYFACDKNEELAANFLLQNREDD